MHASVHLRLPKTARPSAPPNDPHTAPARPLHAPRCGNWSALRWRAGDLLVAGERGRSKKVGKGRTGGRIHSLDDITCKPGLDVVQVEYGTYIESVCVAVLPTEISQTKIPA